MVTYCKSKSDTSRIRKLQFVRPILASIPERTTVYKTELYRSLIWFVVAIFGIGGGCLLYIATHSMGDRLDDIRAGKAGQLAGIIFGVGLLFIWFPVLTRQSR
jgi:hypothetical protein